MNLDNILLSADTARIQGGGRSIYEKVADAMTAGAAGAVVSGLGSIYNTGVAVSNAVFGTQADEIETSRVLADIDVNWARYYEENKSVIDTVGFIGGSFIPGGLAVKALNAARTGRSVGAVGRALGYTVRNQEKYLEEGLKNLGTAGTNVFSTINSNKLKSMAFGAADNVLQTAVFETAAALTMAQSPVLADESWGDIAWDITKTSLAGGLLGGGIEALWTNKIFRDAGKAIESKTRKYDTIVALDKMGLSFGDEAFSLMDSVLKLPKEVFENDKVLKFSYRINGKDNPIDLDLSAMLDNKLKQTVEKGWELFSGKIANVVISDTTVGKPFAMAMLNAVKDAKARGLDDVAIREELGNYLFNLKRIHGVGSEDIPDFVNESVYLMPGATLRSADKMDPAYPFNKFKLSDNAQAYKFLKPPEMAKTGVLGVGDVPLKLEDAWAAGYDLVYRANTTKIHVNPKSAVIKAVSSAEDSVMRVAFNTRTMQTADSLVPTVADMATASKKLQVNANGVVSGNLAFQFSIGSFEATLDSVQNTARHLWATQVKDLRGATIDWRDFSLLDRALAADFVDDLTVIRYADGSLRPFGSMSNKQSVVTELKMDYLQKLLADGSGELDIRAAAYAINVEPAWIEKAIAKEFKLGAMVDEAGKLEPGYMRPLDSYAARDNLVLVYDKPPIANPDEADFVTGLQGYHYRRDQAIQKGKEIAASVLGKHFERFINLDPSKISQQFDATGVGSSFAGFSNANYDDLGRVWAQDVGRAVHLTKQDMRNAALEPLQASAARIIANGNKELGAVLTKVRLTDQSMTLFNGRLVNLSGLKELQKMEDKLLAAGNDARAAEYWAKKIQAFKFNIDIPLEKDTYEFLSAYHEGHKSWISDTKQLASAQGREIDWDPDALYLPPIDTRKVPYFAFVRSREGSVFGTSEVAMITAKSPDELQKLAAQITADHPGMQVLFKKDTEDWFKALGDYQFSSGLNSPQIDPFLRKKGKLGDFMPTLEPKAVIEEFVRYVGGRTDKTVRDAAQVLYGQTFAELRYLSNEYTKLEKSKFAFVGRADQTKITDPFGDYMRTALDISKKSEFTLWHQANEFVDAVGTRAYSAVEEAWLSAKDGKMDWQEANRVMEKMNLGSPFASQEAYLLAQSGTERSLVSRAVAKGNMLLANVALRLDTANALVNIISMPILMGTEMSAIRQSLKKNPELFAQFESQLQVATPDGALQVPSTMKLLYSGIRNFWSGDKQALIERYSKIGAIRNDMHQYHSMMDDLSLTPGMAPKKWAENIDKWTEQGAKFTGNNFAEQFTRFVAADVMRQATQPLVDARKMSMKEQNAFISIFVNRTQGNYVASQRPIMFQGVVGAAIGLFQTYQFNMFQQLFRHIEDKNGKTLAVAAALQSSIFGLNGLPMFDAINTHLIGNANINEGHRDIYSSLSSAVPKELADWAMYGTVSAFPLFGDKAPALFTRGDLNPRHLTIVPTSFADVPIVEASTRVAKAVWGVGNQVANGGDLGTAMLHGLEHNGVSRPLAGLAQVVRGERTTSAGTMVAANSDLMSIASATRILGARPMDESVALNHKYRMVAYKAADRERIEKLGTVIKEKIRNGGLTEDDVLEFASRYAAAGGRVQSYGEAIQRWTKTATQSDINVIMRAQQSSYGQRMMEVMGGDPLPDAVNPEE